MTTDLKTALVVLLKDEATVNTLVSGRVFQDAESFQDEVGEMAQKSISLARSGGPEDNGYLATIWERIDIKCWGETDREASRVYSALYTFLKKFVPQLVNTPDGDIKVYNFTRSGGPQDLRDPEGQWPMVWSSWLMKAHMEALVHVSS